MRSPAPSPSTRRMPARSLCGPSWRSTPRIGRPLRADAAAIRRTNPRDPGAARVEAAAALLLDDPAGYARARALALEVNPHDGAFFAFVAEALTRHRRYDDAREVASAGVAANPEDAACLQALATTLLRLGDEARGVETLRRAWTRDPYDVRTFNLLNLFEKGIPARTTMVASAHLSFRVPAAGARRDCRGGGTLSRATVRRLRGPLWLRAQGTGDVRALRRSARFRGADRRVAHHRRAGGLFRARDHLAGAHQSRLQLGNGFRP